MAFVPLRKEYLHLRINGVAENVYKIPGSNIIVHLIIGRIPCYGWPDLDGTSSLPHSLHKKVLIERPGMVFSTSNSEGDWEYC